MGTISTCRILVFLSFGARSGYPIGMDTENDRVKDKGGVGAEGDGDDAKLPFLPSKGDDTPLGDTDQHSEVPSPPAQTGT